MAAGLTDHPWTIAELVDAALGGRADARSREPVPLAMPAERAGRLARRLAGAAQRAGLPPRRDGCRARGEGRSGPPPARRDAPAAPAVAVVLPDVERRAASSTCSPAALGPVDPERQPPREPSKPLPPGQLGLFAIDLEPEPKK